MGVDAEMMFTMAVTPNPKRLREIQYLLMERVGRSIFWTDSYVDKDKKQAQAFLVPTTEGDIWDGPSVNLPNMVRVKLFCRYYGEGYERGPALELCGTMLVLLSQSDVTSVWYGGDSSGVHGENYTRARVHMLLDYYCRSGHEPYRRAFHKDGEGPTPDCSYCTVPMIRNGFGGSYANFYCSGCGETLKLKGNDFHAWVDGTLNIVEYPRFNGVAQPVNTELF